MPGPVAGMWDVDDLLREPESVGVLAGRPLVTVAVDGGGGLDGLADRLGALPAVTVGVATPGAVPTAGGTVGVDIVLTGTPDPPAPWVWCADVAATVEHLRARAAANPTAAVALVQLLRLSARLDVAGGLVAESFVYGLLQAGEEHRRWLAGRPPRRPRPAGRAVVVERDGAVLEVELHRPEVRNAFSAQMRDELVAAFELVAADPTIEQVRVRGAGPSFCSGGDLDEFGTAEDPSQAHLVRTTRSAARTLLGCAGKTVFAVHGACVGAGLELAALAGRVEADPGTTFLLPEVAMGLVPGAGGTATLPKRIGRHRTAYLALSGLPVDAGTARRWGLVDEVVPARG
ncbi:MAG TPA: enoyl-CoA hydratase/isomerase family protein [Acidimicrobiales bacterium]|nr:enoyl-CoA hydratase/isomerase family protein [Acidimicrobiales bacterium]